MLNLPKKSHGRQEESNFYKEMKHKNLNLMIAFLLGSSKNLKTRKCWD